MKMKRIVAVLLGGLLILLNASGVTAFAETSLPDGAVKGLPERLAALDNDGNHVNSATGEYFFHVENMKFGETYTKSIQIMNLREDAAYQIWFCTEPKFKSGEIDLEADCECRFSLDGKEFYRGSVTGDGNINLKNEFFSLGDYAPGDSHTLKAEIVWNKMENHSKSVDNGHRLVDTSGEHVIEEPSGTAYVNGEIEFKWIFFARVSDGKSSPDELDPGKKPGGDYSPATGMFLKNGTFWLVGIGVVAVLITVLLVMILRSKKKDANKDSDR